MLFENKNALFLNQILLDTLYQIKHKCFVHLQRDKIISARFLFLVFLLVSFSFQPPMPLICIDSLQYYCLHLWKH